MRARINQLAKRRRSIRKFNKEPVSMHIILDILETAHYAPSGANEQPWRFIIIDDLEIKKKIRTSSEKGEKEMYAKVSGSFKEWLLKQGLSPNKPFLEEAPILIVVLMRAGAKYARESIWTAIGYILLALEEHDYSTVPYTPSNTDYPLKVLDAPKEYRLEAILPVGKPDDDSPRTERTPIESLIFHNRWGRELPLTAYIIRIYARAARTRAHTALRASSLIKLFLKLELWQPHLTKHHTTMSKYDPATQNS
jgi:nitroreductase